MMKSLPKPTARALLQEVAFRGGTQITDEDLVREQKIQELEQQQQKFELELERVRLDMELKKSTSRTVFNYLAAETVLVFLIVVIQGFQPYGFSLLDTTLNIFVTATVIQISTMAVIITRHLFPTENNSVRN